MAPQPQFDFSDGSGGGGMGGYPSFGNTNWMGLLGSTGSQFGGMWGGQGGNTQKAASNAAMPYLDKIGQNIPQYFQPYMDSGKWALPQLQQQDEQLVNNPGGMVNKMGAGFQQSPGYQFQVDQATGAANRAASAGGMLGTPSEQQSIAGTVNGLANQDYYNYLNHAQGMYGMGLQGMGDMAHQGLSATNNMTDDLMTQYLSQANDAYAGAAGGGGSGGGSKWGNAGQGALSGAGTGASFGPWGALAGGVVGGVAGFFS